MYIVIWQKKVYLKTYHEEHAEYYMRCTRHTKPSQMVLNSRGCYSNNPFIKIHIEDTKDEFHA